EEDRARGVDPGSQEHAGQLEIACPEVGRVVGDGHRVQVDDAEDVVVVVLLADPVADRPQVVPDVNAARGLDAGENARALLRRVRGLPASGGGLFDHVLCAFPYDRFARSRSSRPGSRVIPYAKDLRPQGTEVDVSTPRCHPRWAPIMRAPHSVSLRTGMRRPRPGSVVTVELPAPPTG